MKHHLLALAAALAAGAVAAAPVTPTRCDAAEVTCAVPELALRGWDGAYSSVQGEGDDASVDRALLGADDVAVAALSWDDIERLDGAERWVPWRKDENELAAWAEPDSPPVPAPAVARRREASLLSAALPVA